MNVTTRWNHFWFGQVPAHRMALFRMAIAVTTVMFFIPNSQKMIHHYLASSFHDPMLPGISGLAPQAGKILIIVQYLAAWGLFFGILPQIGAGFLALSGLYAFLLDTQYYSHWYQFHLILLTLLSFSKERLSIVRWLRRDNESSPTCPAWPENLIRFQLSIVLFHTALNKVFSPYWGSSGEFFTVGFGTLAFPDSSPFFPLREFMRSALLAYPSAASLGVIGLEFFLATAFLFRPLWRVATITGLGFALALQLLMWGS
jgi:hypothetical protein